MTLSRSPKVGERVRIRNLAPYTGQDGVVTKIDSINGYHIRLDSGERLLTSLFSVLIPVDGPDVTTH